MGARLVDFVERDLCDDSILERDDRPRPLDCVRHAREDERAVLQLDGVGAGEKRRRDEQEVSGGQLHEMATHQLDLIRMFAGEITEVHKREARRVNQDQENFTIPDSEITSFQLASGGIGVITALKRGNSDIGVNGGGSVTKARVTVP